MGMDNERPQNAYERLEEARREIKKRILSYIAAGLGLVVGLAWNDAIKALINYFIPTPSGSVVAQIVYAVVLTILVVLILMYIEKLIKKEETT